MNLIFDVDGTLTESRQHIDELFKIELEGLARENNIYIATGSDYSKTADQLGTDFLENIVSYSFNCAGNSIWNQGKEIYKNEWDMPEEVLAFLKEELDSSTFIHKTGAHFEDRPGMFNFSIVGRNATPHQRAQYQDYDMRTNERRTMASKLNNLFSNKYNMSAQVAGTTGFDIFPKGKDKGQILSFFENVPVSFFGDDTAVGGNDYPLALAITKRNLPEDKVYPVKSPLETRYLLSLL